MFILFGEGAPADLAEFCFTMDNHELSGSIHPGSIMKIDGVDLPVTAVGNLVEKESLCSWTYFCHFRWNARRKFTGNFTRLSSERSSPQTSFECTNFLVRR